MKNVNGFLNLIFIAMLVGPVSAQSSDQTIPGREPPPDYLRFDPDWQSENPFESAIRGFHLKFKNGTLGTLFFPETLDAGNPIVIRTPYGMIRQYPENGGRYHGFLKGRYLVYENGGPMILYRVDANPETLREFVYLPSAGWTNPLVRWRFEGAELHPRKDGSLLLTRTIPAEPESAPEPMLMPSTISGGEFANPLEGADTYVKILFILPPPVYMDREENASTHGIHYQASRNQVSLVLDPEPTLDYPLWVDPSLLAPSEPPF